MKTIKDALNKTILFLAGVLTISMNRLSLVEEEEDIAYTEYQNGKEGGLWL